MLFRMDPINPCPKRMVHVEQAHSDVQTVLVDSLKKRTQRQFNVLPWLLLRCHSGRTLLSNQVAN